MYEYRLQNTKSESANIKHLRKRTQLDMSISVFVNKNVRCVKKNATQKKQAKAGQFTDNFKTFSLVFKNAH